VGRTNQRSLVASLRDATVAEAETEP
jgi:hypothetical protein